MTPGARAGATAVKAQEEDSGVNADQKRLPVAESRHANRVRSGRGAGLREPGFREAG